MKSLAMTADEVIELLNLEAHPEGGYYRETYREADSRRGASSAIYFLLRAGQTSAWHRVTDAAEAWHFYAGAALELETAEAGEAAQVHRLGADLTGGERPQAVVPAGVWQRARSLGAWTLVGCTVAPAFLFSSFEMAPSGWEPET